MSQHPESRNITWHAGHVGREDREQLLGHRGATLWFTGLSGSGKSTVARKAEQLLVARGCHAYCLDGDNVRHGLCADLGFSEADRRENIRRVGEVCRLFTDAGVLVLASLVSPYRADRDRVRASMAPGDFLEIHVAAPVATCEARDPKGLYRRARAGEISDFTGVSAPYEPPDAPELVLRTDHEDVETSAGRVLALLQAKGYIPQRDS